MVTLEPVKANIWDALNAYCYADAIFLAERLFAEVHNEEVLHLLATCYHRAGHTNRAYNLLNKNSHCSIHNRFLFAVACFTLNKLPEAEASILGSNHPSTSKPLSAIVSEYGSIAGVVLQLLGNIYRKTYLARKASDCYKESLKCNPLLWTSFQNLCDLGEKVDPLDYFLTSQNSKTPIQQNLCSYNFITPRPQLSSLENNQIYEPVSSENLDPAISGPLLTSTVISKPQQLDFSITNNNGTSVSADLELPPPTSISKVKRPVGKARQRIIATHISDSPLTPSLGCLPADSPNPDLGGSPMFITPPLPSSSCKAPIKAPTKRAPKKKEHNLVRSSLYGYVPSPTFNRSTPCSDAGNLSGLRRSSRLFGTHSTTKILDQAENRRAKVHFEDAPRPTTSTARKAKSRISRTTHANPLTPTTQNIQTSVSSVKIETEDLLIKDEAPILPSPIHQNTNYLMNLLRDIGKAYYALAMFDCKKAITLFDSLPVHQLSTCWMMEKLAIAYFEAGSTTLAEKAFEKVRELDPFYIEEGMVIYSSLLWLSRKDSLLSLLAQDLVDHDKLSPVSWCAMANCFSLQKDHDLAIKFLERAIQLNPEFAGSYSLLGHEYVFTEEFERALSCFRTALRYNERQYNAWYGIGMIYYKQEKYTLAEQHYEMALKINPKSSILLCHLAVTQHDLGRTDEALETVSKANEANPKNALCKYHKARFLLSIDKTQEALMELNELKQLAPKDSLVFFMIGKAYQKLGEVHLAQMNFSWAMSLDPQGTNTMIKEAMNQQRYVTDDSTFLHNSSQQDTVEVDEAMSDIEL